MECLTQRVPHRNASLHRCHRRQGEDAGAVSGSIDTGNVGARNFVDGDVAARTNSYTDLFQTEISAVGGRPDCHQDVGSTNSPAVLQPDHDSVPVADRGHCAGARQDLHAARLEDLLQHLGRVGVFAGENLIA